MKRNSNSPSHENEWKRALAAGIWSSLTVIAVVILARRFAGAFENRLSALNACVVAGLAMLLSISASLLFQSVRGRAVPFRNQLLAGVATLVPPAALGIALLPVNAPWGAAFLIVLLLSGGTALLAIGELAGRLPNDHPASGSRGQPKGQPSRVSSSTATDLPSKCWLEPSASAPFLSEPASSQAVPSVENADRLRQWMTRQFAPDGTEHLEGSMKVDLHPGQKQAVAHLAFSPPFAETPDLECQILDDGPFRTKVSEVRAYGARIEIRRADKAETDATVTIGFHARSRLPRSDAA